jgi:hypothetical protein
MTSEAPLPWLYGRQATDQLSVGYRRVYTDTTGEICRLQHEAPVQRVLRVAYDGYDWFVLQRVYLVVAIIRTYSDAGQTEQRITVPWQGIAIPLPAGKVDVQLTTNEGFEARFDAPIRGGTVSALISHGYGSRQCRQPGPSVVSSQDDGWFAQAGFDLLPPAFATCARLETFEGEFKFIGPTNGVSLYVPTPRGFTVPVPLPGWIRVEGGGTFTVAWEVSL